MIAAGAFGDWLEGFTRTLCDGSARPVPCGECRACCQAGWPVALEPGELEKPDPRLLIVHGVGLHANRRLLVCREGGSCPLLGEQGCVIHPGHPAACRRFDCRVLAACGLRLEGPRVAGVNLRASRWRFTFATDPERRQSEALLRAARFIPAHRELFPGGRVPGDALQLAVLAVKVHGAFLDHEGQSVRDAPAAVAARMVELARGFEQQRAGEPGAAGV